MKIDGKCHCGNITFVAEVDPAQVRLCHCTDCQELSGTAYRINVAAEKDKVQFSGGEPATYAKVAESGTKRVHGFCPKCGTPVFSTSAGEPKVYGLRIGTIRQRRELKPGRQQWCRSALPWAQNLTGLEPRYDKQPG